jgi:hypothetical protein
VEPALLTYLLSDVTGRPYWLVKPLGIGNSIIDTQQGLEVGITNETLKKVYVFIPSKFLCPQVL